MTCTCRQNWCFWSGSPGRPEAEPGSPTWARLCCFLQQPRSENKSKKHERGPCARGWVSGRRGLGHAGVLGATAKVDSGCLDSCVWPGWTTESLSIQGRLRGDSAGAWPSQEPRPQAAAALPTAPGLLPCWLQVPWEITGQTWTPLDCCSSYVHSRASSSSD